MFIKMLLYSRWSSIFDNGVSASTDKVMNYLKRKNARVHCEEDVLKDGRVKLALLQVARNVTTEKYFQPRQLSRKSFTACALS